MRATQETELTVALAGAGADSIVRITQGEPGRAVAPPRVDGIWKITLVPGDYLLTVDSEAPPHTGDPLAIRTTAAVWFVSLQTRPRSAARSLVVWTGTELVADAPGWPPAPPTALSPDPDFLERSPIRDAMRTLMDATTGETPEAPGGIHAVLIGIDAYPARGGTPLYHSLRGAVRDVLEVEKFLVGEVAVARERITRLIAPARDSAGSSVSAGSAGSADFASDSAVLPTYANIVRAWLAAIDAASCGETLYIHYSGHGGRVATLLPAIKKHSKLDEALAPCDINDRAASKYLRDFEIAALLAKSANKGVLTLLVLDCCFAGSAARGHQAQARRGQAEDVAPRNDELATSLVGSADELADIARDLEHGPRGRDAWRLGDIANESPLVTVLAACRQHEPAYEYDVDGRHRQGALTYFWLDALRQRHAVMTYRDAYRQVFAGVQGVFAAQSPLLLGEADRRVLGAERRAHRGSVTVLRVDGDDVTLAAGTSALIEKGTRLAVLPRELLPELEELSQMTQIEVIRAGDTDSTARVVAGTSGTPIDPRVTRGSQAIIVSYGPRLQRNVQLLDDARSSEATAALAALAGEIARDTTRLLAVDAARSADYQVAVDRSTASGALVFSILDPAGLSLSNIRPEIAIGDPQATRRVRDRLVHLARFTNVLNLSNQDPTSALANKIALTLHAERDGQCAPDALPVRPTIHAGTYFYVRIENRSARPLIAALFDLTSDRRIEMFAQTWELDAGQAREIRVLASLRPGHRAITDVLKVIATRSVVSFDWMTLPPLDSPAMRGGTPAHKRAPSNQLERLMMSMQAPAIATRSFQAAPSRDWTEARLVIDVVARATAP